MLLLKQMYVVLVTTKMNVDCGVSERFIYNKYNMVSSGE